MIRAKQVWPLTIVVLLFVVSIFLRLPFYNLDPAKQARWTEYQRWTNTEVQVHDKYVFNVYDQYSPSQHLFAGYIWDKDTFLTNSRINEAVYTSFPPTHFVVMYEIFQLLHVDSSYANMQIFGLVLELICILLLYWLVWELTKDKLMSVLGAAAYTFATGTLWYHMNAYWSHELLMPFFLLALILFVRRKGILAWWQSLLLGFVMSIITWTGIVAAAGFVLYGAYKFFKQKDARYLQYLGMLGGAALAVAAIISQALLATQATVAQYIDRVSARVGVRSVAAVYPYHLLLWRFFNNLLLDYGGFMLIAYGLAAKQKLRKFEWEVLFVATFPLIESFIILEHDSVYGFARLKWLVPIIIIMCICGSRLRGKRARTWLAIFVAAACVVHILLCYMIF